MSYILEALKKAERDRNLGQPPRAEDIAQAAARHVDTPRRSLVPTVTLAISAVLIIAMLGYELFRPAPVGKPATSSPAPVPAPAAVAPAPPAQAPTLRSRNSAADNTPAIDDDGTLVTLDDAMPPPATATLVSPTEGPAAVPDITRPSPRRSLTLGGPLATPGAMPPTPPDAAQSAPDITAPSAPPTTVATAAQPASPTPDTSAAPRSSIKLNGADDDGVMTFQQLPESIRARIPHFDVQVHVWNTDPTKRWALIDGKRMTDGSSISSDVKLQEITPDGLLLNVDGQKVLFSR